jgi:hypothetical protein
MNALQHRKPIGRPGERGSALLIVFVFAAIIAIMLYREMPIAAFEARRQKEQTLIDRGHEYQRAVQLYYRKFRGQYPANINVLENSNNLRFLRRRYTDPFTGKDDWRLLHAGPGGQLMDSKVSILNQNGPFGQQGTNPNNSTFGNSAKNGFGSDSSNQNTSTGTGTSAFGSNALSSSSDSDVTVAPVAKRAPEVAAGGQANSPTSGQLDQDPSIPLLPSPDQASPAPTDAAKAQQGAGNPSGAAVANNQQGTGPNSMQMVQNLFNSGAGQPQAQTAASGIGGGTASTTGSTGNIGGGSFAGVASKAKGHTIKKINEQTDYSLWEFWYDPTKDTSMGTIGNQQNGAGGQNVQNGTPLGQPANSTFGATTGPATGTFGAQNPAGAQNPPTNGSDSTNNQPNPGASNPSAPAQTPPPQ